MLLWLFFLGNGQELDVLMFLLRLTWLAELLLCRMDCLAVSGLLMHRFMVKVGMFEFEFQINNYLTDR